MNKILAVLACLICGCSYNSPETPGPPSQEKVMAYGRSPEYAQSYRSGNLWRSMPEGDDQQLGGFDGEVTLANGLVVRNIGFSAWRSYLRPTFQLFYSFTVHNPTGAPLPMPKAYTWHEGRCVESRIDVLPYGPDETLLSVVHRDPIAPGESKLLAWHPGTPFTEAIEISTGEAVSASDRVWMALPFEVTGLTVNTGDPAPPAGVRVVSLDSWVSRRGL
jgi:hypothetical protein